MMNGMTTTQRHTPTNYQGYPAMRPASEVGGPRPKENGSAVPPVPRRRTRNAMELPMLDIPSPPTPPPSNDFSAIDPELRRAQKSGDYYNISVNINALQMAARPQSSASMRRVASSQDVTNSWNHWGPSPTPLDDQEPGTTVVQVRLEGNDQSPPLTSTSTLPQRKAKPSSKSPPSVNTLQIPSLSGRRSRSVSRSGVDEGYVIKSLKSTSENVASGRTSSTKPVDGKVEFDVELTQQHTQMEQSSSQQTLSSSSTLHRALMIESVIPSTTNGRRLDPGNTAAPAYTMKMNEQMTMNYEPPQPPPPPPPPLSARRHQQGFHEDDVYRRRTRSDNLILTNEYSAGLQSPTTEKRKKKKRPQMVSTATQMSHDKSTQAQDESKQRTRKQDFEAANSQTRNEVLLVTTKSTQNTTSSGESEQQKKKTDKPPKKKTTNVGTQYAAKTKNTATMVEQEQFIDWQKTIHRQQTELVNGYGPPSWPRDEAIPSNRWQVHRALPVNESTYRTFLYDGRFADEPHYGPPDRNIYVPEDPRPPRDRNPYQERDYPGDNRRIMGKEPTSEYGEDVVDSRQGRRGGVPPPSRGPYGRGHGQYGAEPGHYPRDQPRDADDWPRHGPPDNRSQLPTSAPTDYYPRDQPRDADDWPRHAPPDNRSQLPTSVPTDYGIIGMSGERETLEGYTTNTQRVGTASRPDNSRPDNHRSTTDWVSTRPNLDPRDTGRRNIVPDPETVVDTHVTSSAFDVDDENYLRQKLAEGRAVQSSSQLRSGASSGILESRSTASAAVTRRPTRKEEAKALLESATKRMDNVETHFGFEGTREQFVERLMSGAPQGSVAQWEHMEREEEEIFGPLSVSTAEGQGQGTANAGADSAMLNFDTVSEKVELSVARGMAELTVKVRCERIVPVRGGVADLFKKTSIIVTRVIEVDLGVTTERQQLYEHIINEQRQSMTGRLPTKDTFDLYKTFMAMAEVDEAAGRQKLHDVNIEEQVDEQHLLDLQLTASRSALALNDFRRVDGRLPDVDAEDIDFRSRGRDRPIDSGSASVSASTMSASRSRQLFYQS